MAQDQLTNRVRDVEKQLAGEFGAAVSREVIAHTMKECLDSYRGARVADFVPLFVYRQARQRLAALAIDTDRAIAV
ncbi:MAG: hypothetical protein WD904_09315 [Dehalococcoidia bacterium]